MRRGDFRYTADGEIALQSTSTDHYANNAMYFTDAPSGTPFAQSWGRTINESEGRGQVGFCRWHVLGNEIDFNRTLSVTHEAVQRDLSIVDLHRTVVYVYLE